MMGSTKTWPDRPIALPGLLCLLLLLAACSVHAAESVPRKDLENVRGNALAFLRTQQSDNGAFGTVQPQLQTGLAMLALLSSRDALTGEDLDRVTKAAAYVVRQGSSSGDLGDDQFRTESHSICLSALLCATPHIRDAKLRAEVSKAAYRALRTTERWQDRSSSSASRGGWKMEGRKGRENDRRASAWALLSCEVAVLYGLDVKAANRERGLRYLLGSFKDETGEPDQTGGLSVDNEGLAVASASSMGGWFLQRRRPRSEAARQNLGWLARHRSVWSGPNYFYTNFFRLRALCRADAESAEFGRAFRRVFLQIREHQAANGAIAFPPGNAQNTAAMGPVFSTAASLLILNADDSSLVFDEDFRVRPLF